MAGPRVGTIAALRLRLTYFFLQVSSLPVTHLPASIRSPSTWYSVSLFFARGQGTFFNLCSPPDRQVDESALTP